jgi:hypothetical protein
MAAHTDEQRVFIIRRLAEFESPQEIITAFAARWRTTSCALPDIEACDPRRTTLSPLHLAIFTTRRTEYLANLDVSAPTANKTVRLVWLHQMAERYRNNNQPADARSVLRQIAEEQGDVGPGKAGKAEPPTEPVTSITRTIVDPSAPVTSE